MITHEQIENLIKTKSILELQTKALEIQNEALQQDQILQQTIDQNIKHFQNGFEPLKILTQDLDIVTSTLQTTFQQLSTVDQQIVKINQHLNKSKLQLKDSFLQKKKLDQLIQYQQIPHILHTLNYQEQIKYLNDLKEIFTEFNDSTKTRSPLINNEQLVRQINDTILKLTTESIQMYTGQNTIIIKQELMSTFSKNNSQLNTGFFEFFKQLFLSQDQLIKILILFSEKQFQLLLEIIENNKQTNNFTDSAIFEQLITFLKDIYSQCLIGDQFNIRHPDNYISQLTRSEINRIQQLNFNTVISNNKCDSLLERIIRNIKMEEDSQIITLTNYLSTQSSNDQKTQDTADVISMDNDEQQILTVSQRVNQENFTGLFTTQIGDQLDSYLQHIDLNFKTYDTFQYLQDNTSKIIIQSLTQETKQILQQNYQLLNMNNQFISRFANLQLNLQIFNQDEILLLQNTQQKVFQWFRDKQQQYQNQFKYQKQQVNQLISAKMYEQAKEYLIQNNYLQNVFNSKYFALILIYYSHSNNIEIQLQVETQMQQLIYSELIQGCSDHFQQNISDQQQLQQQNYKNISHIIETITSNLIKLFNKVKFKEENQKLTPRQTIIQISHNFLQSKGANFRTYLTDSNQFNYQFRKYVTELSQFDQQNHITPTSYNDQYIGQFISTSNSVLKKILISMQKYLSNIEEASVVKILTQLIQLQIVCQNYNVFCDLNNILIIQQTIGIKNIEDRYDEIYGQ